MKEEIEQFKKENGSVNYTVKELIHAMHTKIDRVNEKVSCVDRKLNVLAQTTAEKYVDKSMFRWVIGGMVTVLIFIIGWMIAT